MSAFLGHLEDLQGWQDQPVFPLPHPHRALLTGGEGPQGPNTTLPAMVMIKAKCIMHAGLPVA